MTGFKTRKDGRVFPTRKVVPKVETSPIILDEGKRRGFFKVDLKKGKKERIALVGVRGGKVPLEKLAGATRADIVRVSVLNRRQANAFSVRNKGKLIRRVKIGRGQGFFVFEK